MFKRSYRLSADEWEQLLAILSLDSARELLPYSGLLQHNFESAQVAIRKAFRVYGHVFMDWTLDDSKFESEVAIVVSKLDLILDELGVDIFSAISRWASTVYASNELYRRWYGIEHFFRQWANGFERFGSPPISFSCSTELLRRFRDRTSIVECKIHVDALRYRPLSQWDSEVYRAHGFYNDSDLVERLNRYEDLTVAKDPLEIVLDTIQLYRFQCFWREQEPAFSKNDRTLLIAAEPNAEDWL